MYDASPQQGQRIAQPPQPAQPAQPRQSPQPPPPPEVPRTQPELEALATKRSELKQQLESVTDRREELSDQLNEAHVLARGGLEERIKILDERATRLEREILQLDDAIAIAAANGLESEHIEQVITVPPDDHGNMVTKDVLANAMLAEALAFVLLGMFVYRRLLKRARERFARGSPADSSRLDQLQNSVDTIALEIERISEGQRFVTRALNEGMQQPVSAEAREEVLVPRKP